MTDTDPLAKRTLPADQERHRRVLARLAGELRRGDPIRIRSADGRALLVWSPDGDPEGAIDAARWLGVSPAGLLLGGHRAFGFGLGPPDGPALSIAPLGPVTDIRWLDAAIRLSDPATVELSPGMADGFETISIAPGSLEDASLRLARNAGLMPVMLVGDGIGDGNAPPSADGGDVMEVAQDLAEQAMGKAEPALRRVAESSVPLTGAENTRVVAFRPDHGETEHFAIVIGRPTGDGPVLCRLHSSCFTGDALGSLRCDCGEQLRGAIDRLAAEGGGVICYLSQEGRGIGLVNKLRAYALQDCGLDTLDANLQLGFGADERDYGIAAAMLRDLGISEVRLLTNNPAKNTALAAHGITVAEQVRHAFPPSGHNEAYLQAKAKRFGHLI